MRLWAAATAILFLTGCGGCGDTASGPRIAKRIERPDELIGGTEATGRVGDFLLANDRVRFIVQEPSSGTGWSIYGGSLVDLDRVRAPGDAPAGDRLEEMFVQCDLRAFAPERAEIVNDGTDGGPGIVRFVGKDAGIPFLDAVLPRDPLQVELTVDWILAPGSESLKLSIRAKDLRRSGARELGCGVILLKGDGLPIFLDGAGSEEARAGGDQPYLAAAAWDGTASYALYRPNSAVEVVLAQLEVLPIATQRPFPANGTVEEKFRIAVGTGDVESALAVIRREKGDELVRRPVNVRMTWPDLGIDPATAVLTFSDRARPEGNRSVTSARANGEGVATAALAAGTYEVDLELAGRYVERFELEVPPGDSALQATHEVSALGGVTLTITELGLDSQPVLPPGAARVRFAAGHDAPISVGAVLERYVRAPVAGPFVLPPGPYTVVVSMGPEHEIARVNVEVAAGEIASATAEVQRVVDRSGFISADVHVHATRSSDSRTAARVRVLGAAAEGLDLLVATDHDAVTSYAGLVTELGLDARLRTVSGIEMSMLYGHMNGYPLEASAPLDHWRPAWFVYDQNGLFERTLEPDEVADALLNAGARVVQINHPRSGQGVFGYLGLSDVTGDTRLPWPDAHAVELLNGKRMSEYPAVLASWRAVLAAGRRITAVGSSDVHSDFGVGYARTYVKSSSAQPALEEVWTNLRAGRAVAAFGPFVEVTAQSAGRSADVGDTLESAEPVQLSVKVQAPSWMAVDTLRIYERERELVVRDLRPEDADPLQPALRFQGTFTSTPTADVYYVVEVSGPRSLPLIDEEALSVTNPIWVDVDGGGIDLSR